MNRPSRPGLIHTKPLSAEQRDSTFKYVPCTDVWHYATSGEPAEKPLDTLAQHEECHKDMKEVLFSHNTREFAIVHMGRSFENWWGNVRMHAPTEDSDLLLRTIKMWPEEMELEIMTRNWEKGDRETPPPAPNPDEVRERIYEQYLKRMPAWRREWLLEKRSQQEGEK